MRKDLGQAVRKEFRSRMATVLPDFVEQKRGGPPGFAAHYTLLSSPKLSFFLSLQFHRIWNSFTVELAWSRDGKYPSSVPPGDPNSDGNELRFRVGRLWAPPPTDVWWEVRPGPVETKEQILERIRPPVLEAVEQIATYSGPYMRRVIESA